MSCGVAILLIGTQLIFHAYIRKHVLCLNQLSRNNFNSRVDLNGRVEEKCFGKLTPETEFNEI